MAWLKGQELQATRSYQQRRRRLLSDAAPARPVHRGAFAASRLHGRLPADVHALGAPEQDRRHLAACSLLSALARHGFDSRSFAWEMPLALPPCAYAATTNCTRGCWWAERLRSYTAAVNRSGGFSTSCAGGGACPRSKSKVRVLELEAGNARQVGVVNGQLARHAEPGFDAARDGCLGGVGVAYATILRPPVERTHSHMCEVRNQTAD